MMASAQNPFGAPSAQPAPNNPFAPSSFGRPSGQFSTFGAPSGPAPKSQAPSHQPSPSLSHASNPFSSTTNPPSTFGTASQPSNPPNGPQHRPSPPGSMVFNTTPYRALQGDASQPLINPWAKGNAAPKATPGIFGGPSDTAVSFAQRPIVFSGRSPEPETSSAKSHAFYPSAFSRESSAIFGRKPVEQERPPTDSFGSKIPTTQPNGRVAAPVNKFGENRSDKSQASGRKPQEGTAPQPTEETRKLSAFAGEFAEKLHAQLRKDGIKPPSWPPQPGNPHRRPTMEKLKETYKRYRAKVYASLRKAELIDDPEKRRRLEDALPFKGICEDMCPDYEVVTRICEYDVKQEEKVPDPNQLTTWPEPTIMVKKFGRSAAGQDAPLPMDVRSVDALKRTTDYLLGELLQTDAQLPALHNFLWDRTRAVRKDFTFHSTKTPEEMKVLVYCFENITRFHATALHLLSRKGFAAEDFEQKQEIEQLGRSLLSLIEAYDDCREKGVECENEAEFRAYHLLLNTHDPFIVQRSLEWGAESWFNSEDVQLAFSLINAMQSVEEQRGPLRPIMGSTLSDSSFTNFFSIVESPKVSYTMACFAEIHFTHIRQCILKSLVKAYSRRRDWPRDITASALNRMLRFDADEEAVEFAERHGFEFSSGNSDQPYLELKSKRKHVPSPRVPQSYSAQLVERKRNKQSLAYVIRNTVYEETRPEPASMDDRMYVEEPDSLFVPQTDAMEDGNLPGQITQVQAQVQAQAPSVFDSQPAAGSSTATNITTNGFPFPSGPLPGPFSPPPWTTNSTTPGLQKAVSPFFPVATSTAGPSAGQATTTVPAPSLKQPNPFAPRQEQPPQVPVSMNPSPADAAISALPPMQPGPTAFPFSNKTPENVQFPAAQSVPSDPANTGPATPFISDVPSSGAKDSVPSFTVSPLTPTGQQGTATAQAADTSQEVRFPVSQPSVLSSASNKSDVPVPGFFPSTTVSKEAPSAQGTEADSATPGPLSSTSGVGDSAADKAGSLPPADVSALNKPPVTQPTTATDVNSSGPLSVPSPAQQPSSIVAGEIAKPSESLLPSTALAPAQPPTPPSDPMGGLARWYVKGDGGLMEQFIEAAVQDIVQDTYRKWQVEEAERRRKEEDEKSWEAARKHQNYNLRVKFFYKWQKNARALAHRRILREGKAKMKAFREQERAAEKARKAAKIKAQEHARRKAKYEEDIARLLHWDMGKSQLHTEEQLLASGIFSGLNDERETVRRVVKGISHPDAMNKQFSRETSVASSQETTPASMKKEGWKTRSLRERYGADSRLRRSDRRSNSISSSVNTASDFSRSLPVPKVTNFSRKRYADESSEEEPSPKRTANGVKSKHWELRARGLVQMPDGQWLPESIALPMQEGKRFRGIGDCGLGPGRDEPLSDDEGHRPATDPARFRLEQLAARFGISVSKPRTTTAGMTVNGTVTTPAAKRKRSIDDDGSPVNGRQENGSPPGSKKLAMDEEGDDTQKMVESTQKMLQELRETMDKMDEDRPWFREQIELMEKQQSMWG